ncbi:MAG TPA: hypothetical protein VFU47_09985 [Armatimonadota bacterium]|nr:hypothetical protein [Armatimonadota bacterium]
MAENAREPIRVRYDHQETGWAIPLPHSLASVENIPLTGRCNVGDIVRLEASGREDLPWVGEVLHRRYSAKTVLYYHGSHELQTLCSLLRVLGCETETARRPLDSAPGVLLVAHDPEIRPDILAGAAGIPQPSGSPTRILMKGGALVADTGQIRLEAEDGSEAACWAQTDWTADPEVAAEALDTLLRCLHDGVGPAQRPVLEPRPLTIRFRRFTGVL